MAQLPVCVSVLDVSPAKASDQHANDERAQQTSDSEDRHSERVHEGQGLLTESCSISAQHCLVVKVFYVLRGEEIEETWRRKSEQEQTAQEVTESLKNHDV